MKNKLSNHSSCQKLWREIKLTIDFIFLLIFQIQPSKQTSNITTPQLPLKFNKISDPTVSQLQLTKAILKESFYLILAI